MTVGTASDRRSVLVPALLLTLVAVALPLAVATAPVPAVLLGLLFTGGVVALRALGARMTLWCLFVATVPLREPLSLDVVGTKTLYLNDVLLLPLLAVVVYENGIAGIWRRSPAFRIGTVLVLGGALGIYTAAQWVWTVNHVYQEAMQVAALYVAWHMVRDARQARWTLIAFLIGMAPAAVYGYWESTLPVTEAVRADGTVPARAWSPDGTARVRPMSTFWNPLAFSLGLTVAFGIAVGWLFLARSNVRRFLAGVSALAFLACNQFTYSLGGLAGSVAAVGTAFLVPRRRWIMLAAPVVALAWLMVAPVAFVNRVDKVFRGEHSSLAVRLIGYGQALEIVRDHPVFGVGWGNITSEMEGEYRVARANNALQPRSAENYFLQRAMALGLVGLILTVTLCILFFRNVLTRPPPTPEARGWPQASLLITGVAFYVQIQAQPASDPFSRYVLWLLIALAERMRAAYRGET